jgi:hypothetical protein
MAVEEEEVEDEVKTNQEKSKLRYLYIEYQTNIIQGYLSLTFSNFSSVIV